MSRCVWGHPLGVSWPQKAIHTQGAGAEWERPCPLDTCPGLHTHIESQVYMQLWSPVVSSTWL